MNKITEDVVRKVAELARLKLPDQKITTFTEQIETILKYVGQLEKVDTHDIPETTRAIEVKNVTRDDFVDPISAREEILNQAPQREGDFYRVPKILTDG